MRRLTAAIALGATVVVLSYAATEATLRAASTYPDASGLLATIRLDNGPVVMTGPFFQPLSSNGRSCSSCHRPAQGWTISAEEVRQRFDSTDGRDPIFRSHDAAVCDHGVKTRTVEDRRAAYRLLLDRALIRMPIAVPANAEFDVVNVANPYGCSDRSVLSTYRRPLPATNLKVLTSVMWDARESSGADLREALLHQAMDAATLHAQVRMPNAARLAAIVEFEMSTATAQISDREAGALDIAGADGGPVYLADETIPSFFAGINDPGGGDPHRIKPENSFRLFDDWSRMPYGRVYVHVRTDGDDQARRRDAISRGQVLFNQMPFRIQGVAGFNDELRQSSITAACGTCHDSVNTGGHSRAVLMNTGVSDAGGAIDVSYLPVVTLRNKTTGEIKVTTDPGAALVSGQWKDVGRMKVPGLRGLAARAPYFHNGSARTLADVVDYYDKRFNIGFSGQNKSDLIAFLSSL